MANRATHDASPALKAHLRDAEESYQDAKRAAESAARNRDSAMRLAYMEYSVSVREIAAIMGVSFQLVGRIVGRENNRKGAAA